MDFNQKRTTVNLGASYTNNSVNAILDPTGDGYFRWGEQHQDLITTDTLKNINILRGKQEDWSTQLGLTQVINPDAVMELGFGYTGSSGFLENPYKLSWLAGSVPSRINSTATYVELPNGLHVANFQPFIEQRPNERNLFNWNARWTQYVAPLDAALHVGYGFAYDDWNINAHTFDADWVQPVGAGWTVTPRIRYY